MSPSPTDFATILARAIDRVKFKEGKKKSELQQELGEAIGKSEHTLINWQRGNIPSRLADLEAIARILVERGGIGDPQELDKFLRDGGHSHPADLSRQLFPPVTPQSPDKSEIVVFTPAPPALVDPKPATPRFRRWHPYHLVGIAVIGLIGIIGAMIFLMAQPSSGAASTLNNPGFEEGGHLPFWAQNGWCNSQVKSGKAEAFEGQSYLTIANPDSKCKSFYQDIAVETMPGETYRFSIWMRSAEGSPRLGELAIWAGSGTQLERSPFNSFHMNNLDWRCIETSLTPVKQKHQVLRIEVALQSPPDDSAYDFDGAEFTAGKSSNCPQPNVSVNRLWLQREGPFYPGSTLAVEAEVKNYGNTPVEAGQISYWIAAHQDGEAINPDFITQNQVPALSVGASSHPLYADIDIPPGLSPGKYFAVAQVNGLTDTGNTNLAYYTASVPFTLTACSEAGMFCDVPLQHWAHPEIEAFRLTTGCRTSVEPPFLPYCPEQVLDRAHLAAFLVRHLHQNDNKYKSTGPFYGRFADVPKDMPQALYIEELSSWGLEMDSRDCQPGRQPTFCPYLWVKRGDVARYLARIEKWDLEPAIGIFADLPGDDETTRAVEYMWRRGFIITNEPDCPSSDTQQRFCPELPLRRASAAVFMARAFGFIKTAPTGEK